MKGSSLTRQRQAVLDALCSTKKHLAAVEVWETAKEGCSGLSLATVYNSLRHLVEMNLITEIRLDDGVSRYDARVDHHAHVICSVCGVVQDIDMDEAISSIENEVQKSMQFQSLHTEVRFTGICPACTSFTLASSN